MFNYTEATAAYEAFWNICSAATVPGKSTGPFTNTNSSPLT